MNVRTVVTFLVIAIGLTAYSIQFESGDAPWEGAGKVFSSIEPSDIVWLEIDRRHSEGETQAGAGASKIVLERRSESEPNQNAASKGRRRYRSSEEKKSQRD